MRCADLAQLKMGQAPHLAPVYLVGGDEPLLVQEACDAIRHRARALGIGERECHGAERPFSWSGLADVMAGQSLFDPRRLVEVLMPEKLSAADGAVLADYLSKPSANNHLLLVGRRMKADALRAKWCQAAERVGVLLWIKPVAPAALPAWLRGRAQSLALRLDNEAASLLADYVEGNLLAAAQELDKLSLLLGDDASVSAEDIVLAQPDSAQYSAWQLRDAALGGDAQRCVSVLRGLRMTGNSPLQALGAIVHELRSLARIAWRCGNGASESAAMQAERVWRSRQPLVSRALRRLPLATLHQLLGRASQIDQAAKGLGVQSPWDELERLALRIAWRSARR